MKKEYYDVSHDDTPSKTKADRNWNYQLAYDKKQSLYVAYDVDSQIVATGVCIPSAIENFKDAFFAQEAKFAEGYLSADHMA